MKLLFTTVIAAFLLATTANAQVNFGVKAGLNLYNVHGNDIEADPKAGVHFGILSHIHLSELFALQPEIVYSMQGAKMKVPGEDFRTNLDYLNIPILLQYMFDNGLRLQAGPQFGFLLSAKSKRDGNSVDVSDGFNSVDVSLPFGIGYVFPSGFGIDARYSLGLTNINENDDVKVMNGGLQLGAFYMFNHD